MGNFGVQLGGTAARNPMVGGRQIPITKFTRGSTRGHARGATDGEGAKRG